MVEVGTEQIRCILCNKNLDVSMQDGKELFICANCQAYFCPECLEAVRNYDECPAARLLGVKDHELKFIKLLPPKTDSTLFQQVSPDVSSSKVKILPKKTIRVISEKSTLDKKKTKEDNSSE